jgi:toxin CcdB
MARFDVYANRHEGGYLLDVQSDLLGRLNTRVVVPLQPLELAPKGAERLNPTLRVQGTPVLMVTQFMAAIPASELAEPVANLERERESILQAIDFLHQGW